MIRVLSIAMFLLAAAGAWAQDVQFDIQPRVLQLGESATLTLTVMGEGQFKPPSIPPSSTYDIVYVGTERRFSYGSGGGGRYVLFRYQLRPKQQGKITVGPFAYDIGGQKAELKAIELQVAAGAQSAHAQAAQTQLKDLLFARAEVKTGNIYKQEVFDLTISVFHRKVNLARGISFMGFPETGFAIKPVQELPPRREIINNQVYDVSRYRCKIHALTTGTFSFEPIARVALLVPRKQQSNSPFNDPFFSFDIDSFFGRAQRQEVDIKLPPLTITITDPPAQNQPESYAGAVGNFKFFAQAGPTNLMAGEPVTLTMTLSGEGNIDTVPVPTVVGGDAFKMYEPRMVTKEVDEATSSGRKIFEQVVIPRSDKVTEVPPIRFSFFDPKRETYEELVQGPFPLVVAPAPETSGYSRQSPSLAPQEIEELGSDIVYLKESPGRLKPIDTRYSLVFYAAQAVPVVLFAGFWLYRRRKNLLAGDEARARRQKAPRAAREGLRLAREAQQQDREKDFYEAVWKTLSDYFGHRLNLQPGEISFSRIKSACPELDDAQKDTLNKLFSQCEAYRYAPGTAEGSSLEALFKELEQLLQDMEGRKK